MIVLKMISAQIQLYHKLKKLLMTVENSQQLSRAEKKLLQIKVWEENLQQS